MKKLMKLLAIILALLMTLALIACSAGKAEGDMEPEDGGMYFPDSVGGSNGSNIMNSYGDPNDQMPSVGDDAEYGDEMENAPNQAPETDAVQDPEPDETSSNEGIENETDAPSGEFIKKPFTSVEENKFSTFSADVDTASYTYFRKLVNSGYLFENLRNSGNTFRTEEFINYFRYDVEHPGDGELFGVKREIMPCPWDKDSMVLRVTLQAENAVNTKGNNLVFLIDVSGSMSSQDKLPLLKKAFSYLIGNLGPNDTVSIVTYSGRESVVLDGCKGAEGDKITAAMNSLGASGSTNGEAGITMAYQIAEKHFIEGGNNRIIMASDGDLNVGISSASELKSFIEQKRDQGIYLSILGFGTGNYRDDRMEALADNGNGVYYYIDGESEAEKVFGTDLTGTLYTVANDVKLQIEFDPEYVDSYRLIGYDNRILDKEDFEDDTKDAGEVGASHQVTVCYEIKLKEDKNESIDNYLTLRVRYKNPGQPLSLLNEYGIGEKEMTASGSEDARFIASVIELASLLHNPSYNGDITIQGILETLDSLNLTDPYKIEFRELVRKLAQ